ncbi:MAG: hypothetical protein WDZ74_02650 [Candidatus Paceibacterota bacterium]
MEKKSLVLRLAVIIGAVLVLSLIVFLNNRDNSAERSADGAVEISGGAESFDPTAFELDSDNDGLRDWEESLWGTDKNNPDTDGDGTSDGAEVTAGREPLIPGPDDQVETATVPSYKRTDAESLTTTQAFERDYYRGIAQLSAEGQLNNETLQTFIMGLTREYVVNAQINLEYSESDLSITSDPSIAVAKEYGNRLGRVASMYAEIDFEQELGAIQRVVQSGGSAGIAELNVIIAEYRAARVALLEIETVPFALAEAHLSILNGVSGIETALNEMKASLVTDPLKGMIRLSHYQQGVLLIVQGSQGVVEYYEGRNISFSTTEPGLILMNE